MASIGVILNTTLNTVWSAHEVIANVCTVKLFILKLESC